MRYLVLGAGVGKAIAYFLSRQRSTHRLVLADADFDKAEKACKMIRGSELRAFCMPMKCDSEKLTPKYLSQFDVVVSALPARFNYNLAEKCIDAVVNFCDLGGVVNITEKMIGELNNEAKKNCVTIVPDCGIMPGLGIMLAREFAEEFDRAVSVCIYVGGIPQRPRPPLYYERVFNIEGLESICYDSAPVLEDGQIVMKDPFSDLENFRVKELASFSPDGEGSVEAFNTAGASIAHKTFHNLGLANFCEKTVRWPKFAEFVSKIPRHEFVERVGGLTNKPIDRENPDLLWMKVVALGTSGNKTEKKRYEMRTATLFELFDDNTGLTAMEKCTAYPTAVIAKFLARHRAKVGVVTPEKAFEIYQLRQMREELKKHLSLRVECKAV